MATVHGQQHSFSTHERMFFWMCQGFWNREDISTWGGLEHPTFAFMPYALTIWAIRAMHLLSHVFEYWLWWYRYFCLSRVNNWIVNLRGQHHSFSTHVWVFLWKCQSFWDRKCLDLSGLEHPTFVFMPYALTIWAIRAMHLLSHVFEYWLWWYRYFYLSRVNNWNVNLRGQQHSFSTHVWVFLWKCQSFWDRKCLDLRGIRTPNLRFQAVRSNHFSYQGHASAVPRCRCF